MFDTEFYPTPKEIVLQMIEDLNLSGKTVLEPSAGHGAIIDIVQGMGANVLACEKDDDLAIIASQKADVFLKKDFFSVDKEEVGHVDHIIMNPPFSNADAHILHAYEIAPDGCSIIALCNNETIDNPFSRQRRVLKSIIADCGISQNLGNTFSSAERKTDIEVAMIKLFKPGKGEDEFKDYLFSDEEEEAYTTAGIVKHSFVREIVGRYIQGVQMFETVVEASKNINMVIKPLGGSFKLQFDAIEQRGDTFSTITRDEYKKRLQKSAWRAIFKEMKMQKYLTKSVMTEVNRFVEEQLNKPFTMKNIFTMVEIIIGTHGGRMKKVVEEVFDWLTKHHHENRKHVEGWKTNSMYLVNQKFIAPYCGVSKGFSGQPEIRWSSTGETIDELVKALCFLTAQNYDDCDTLYQFFRGEPINDDQWRTEYMYKEWGKWYDWNFFQIKVFKKGTLHAKFKNEKVWELFNREAAKAKGWRLPSRTGSDVKRKETGVEIYSY